MPRVINMTMSELYLYFAIALRCEVKLMLIMNRAKPCQMLHTKSQFHRPSGSGADFYRVFTIYGFSSQLDHMKVGKKAATGQLLVLALMIYITRYALVLL